MTPASRERGGVSFSAIFPVILAAVAVVAFSTALYGVFLFDDRPLIADNTHVHDFTGWRRWFSSDFWDVSGDTSRVGPRIVYWRPLVLASYALDWTIGRGSVVVFHVTNLAAHALATVLGFRAVRRWTGDPTAAFFATLVIVAHPTRAESVAWISGRTDLLCVVAVLFAIEGVARRLAGERGGVALEIVATAIAYMTKEQATVLPAFVAVEAWVVAGRGPLDGKTIGKLARAAIPQALVAVAYLAVRARWLPFFAYGGKMALTASTQAAQFVESVGRYIVLTIAPHDLSVEHALIHTTHGVVAVDGRYALFGLISLVALVATAWLVRLRLPGVSLGLALYLGTLLPTSNAVARSLAILVSERFLYLPLLAVAWLVAQAIAALRQRGQAVPIEVAAAALGAASVVVSMRRSIDFSDDVRFWGHELSLHPSSIAARSFFIEHAQRANDLPVAIVHAERATLACAERYAHDGCQGVRVVETLSIAARLVPDRDVATLQALDLFARDLIDGAPSATLTLRSLGGAGRFTTTMSPTSPAIAATLGHERFRLFGLRSDLASRLGDDAAARRFQDGARGLCARCPGVLQREAFLLGREGRFDEAFRATQELASVAGGEIAADVAADLDRAATAAAAAIGADPAAARLLYARTFAALGLWGRAEDALGDGDGFDAPTAKERAEIAWRAGDPERARAILANAGDAPDAIARATHDWSRAMGWVSP